MNTTELTIDEFSTQGFGVATWHRPDNLVRKVIIPATLPGEVVLAEVRRCKIKKASSFIGVVSEIKKPSPLRIIPKCRHFTLCGGCVWQQMPYAEQLKVKEQKIKELFTPLLTDETKILPIIKSPSEWNYRTKMEFSFSQDKKGSKFLGLMILGSKGRVFNLEECHLMRPWVASLVQSVRTWWNANDLNAYYLPKNSGSLRTLTLRESEATGDRVIILTVSGNPEYAIKRSLLDEFVSLCEKIAAPSKDANLSVILRIQQVAKGRPTEFFEMRLVGPDSFRERVKIHDKTYEFFLSPSSFFQPNGLVSSLLYQAAIDMAELTGTEVLYDLYAGCGVFGMLAADRVRQVISIELSADSSYDARCNSQRLQLHNFQSIQGDVGKVLKDKSLPTCDVVLCDPPRSGLGDQAIKEILSLSAQKIVYVSCNPATQRDDIEKLVSSGYSFKALQPVDQFPQTVHCENIVLLSRN